MPPIVSHGPPITGSHHPVGLPSRWTWAWVGLLACSLVASGARFARANTPLDPTLFPTPPDLGTNVLFWTDVYSRYSSKQVVIHDNLYLDVVYTVLDFTPLDREDTSDDYKASVRDDSVRKAIHTYEDILEDLAQVGGPRETSPPERREVENMFRRVPGGDSKYRSAIERIRSQTGLKDRFEAAIRRSGRYMPAMERMFRSRGLPLELTRLPFVESMFQDRARSKVGAGGIWQFMPSTGRLFLRMRPELDERWDPLAATDGAARLLADNYERLGTWPLALTAYNHGAAGMARAAKQLGTTDLGTIVWQYDGGSFGFASRNFYCEFLAAASVYANRDVHFPGVLPDPPMEFDELVIDRPVPLKLLSQTAGFDTDALEDLNLGLTPEVWSGRYTLPAGYRLRVPVGARDGFQTALASIPEVSRTAKATGARIHRVAKGDTVSSIARRYGASPDAILKANGMRSANRLQAGQRLRIPGAANDGSDSAVASAPSPPAILTVSRVETPPSAKSAKEPGSSAAVAPMLIPKGVQSADLRTGAVRSTGTQPAPSSRSTPSVRAVPSPAVSGNSAPRQVAAAKSAPSISPTRSAPKPVTHKVRRGETLVDIAQRYGTSVAALKKENRLRGQLIQPNQVLNVPIK